MKQDLSQIHIWEAFENEKSECPICEIEKRSKRRLIESFFSEIVMDYKFQVSIGVQNYLCKEHLNDLYEHNDKLGLAIIVERMLEYEKDKLKKKEESSESLNYAKSFKDLFRKKKLISTYHRHECYICSKLRGNVRNSIEILIGIWKNNEEFRNLYSSSKGFCMRHFHELLDISAIVLNDADKIEKFKDITTKLQHNNLARLQEELNWFIQKFDYRFDDRPWGNSKDSLVRSIIKITGNLK